MRSLRNLSLLLLIPTLAITGCMSQPEETSVVQEQALEKINAPSEEERKINEAMKDLWYEMVEKSDDLVTDEDVAKVLAPQFNKTVDEMVEIRMKVSDYDLGL